MKVEKLENSNSQKSNQVGAKCMRHESPDKILVDRKPEVSYLILYFIDLLRLSGFIWSLIANNITQIAVSAR